MPGKVDQIREKPVITESINVRDNKHYYKPGSNTRYDFKSPLRMASASERRAMSKFDERISGEIGALQSRHLARRKHPIATSGILSQRPYGIETSWTPRWRPYDRKTFRDPGDTNVGKGTPKGAEYECKRIGVPGLGVVKISTFSVQIDVYLER